MSLDIEIKNARVYFQVKSGYVRAVDGISATFKEGEITGIIGESGCGKSVLGMYLLGMLPDYAVKSGEIWYDGKNLETFTKKERRKIRGPGAGTDSPESGRLLKPCAESGRADLGSSQAAGQFRRKKRLYRNCWRFLDFRKTRQREWQELILLNSAAECSSEAVAAMGTASGAKLDSGG